MQNDFMNPSLQKVLLYLSDKGDLKNRYTIMQNSKCSNDLEKEYKVEDCKMTWNMSLNIRCKKLAKLDQKQRGFKKASTQKQNQRF